MSHTCFQVKEDHHIIARLTLNVWVSEDRVCCRQYNVSVLNSKYKYKCVDLNMQQIQTCTDNPANQNVVHFTFDISILKKEREIQLFASSTKLSGVYLLNVEIVEVEKSLRK